jgi:seryl-tRNA synthetase
VHDARILLHPDNEAVRRLGRRGHRLDAPALEDLLSRRNAAIDTVGRLRGEARHVAEDVRERARDGGDTAALRERARALKGQIAESEGDRNRFESELHDRLAAIPNLPADDIPDGGSEEFAVEVRRHGAVPSFPFEPRDHVELGEAMGILDFERAAKLSGPRFGVARGVGAALERAIASFLLELHTARHGYVEYSVPNLVTRRTMTGTGQLPKFEDDLFKTGAGGGSRELYLIPTAEVPLTNLHADETLEPSALPLALTAYTPCYRSEAGSYGRDTRGLLRLHQFSKVELVRICAAEDAPAELEKLVGHAEAGLRELGLAYRVVLLPAGDMGFSARKTYDLEVWLPGQQRYREISSCSDCGTFQARRANIRTRGMDGERVFAATLNGSGLPIGRTMAAILEQFQQGDGSVVMPKPLVPFLGFPRLAPDGRPEQ